MRTTLGSLGVLLLAVGCGDGGNEPSNTPPTVTLTSPADGATFIEGQPVTVSVTVTDPDEFDLSVLSLEWSGSAATGTLPAHTKADGTVSFDLPPAAGSYDLSVSVTDPQGESDSASAGFTVAADADDDGYSVADDCDDTNADIHPGATELCNGLDDDCANGADDGLAFSDWFEDGDGDGYGDAASATSSCEDLSATLILDGTDCDDAAATLNHDDLDVDGTDTCAGDCDDLNATIEPGAAEVCNSVDDDCANGVDDGIPTTTWYGDVDHDGYGNAAVVVTTCLDLSATHVLDGTDCNDLSSTLNHDDDDVDGVDSCAGDCNDHDAAVLPGALEVCNGVDDNCAAGIDDGFVSSDWYEDADSDGYGDPASLVRSCLDLSADHITDGSDCDDNDSALNQDDVDFDGTSSCDGDCDDANPLAGPNLPDICNGGIDDDCDPTTVETALADGVNYTSIGDAVAGVSDGGTVDLCTGVFSVTAPISVTKAVTIVGAGPDWTATTIDGTGATNALFIVSATGSLGLQTLTVANAPAGAIRGSAGAGTVIADDVLFTDNRTTGNGGAISAKTVTVSNSEFIGNSAANGGAIFVSAGGLLTVTGTTFDGNSASVDGGAFHTASSAVFTAVDVIGNTAVGNGGGGVLTTAGGSATFADTLFSANTAANGGAMWVVATSVDVGDTTTFDGNTASDDTFATYGGGVWFQATGQAVTWTGGLFTNNLSSSPNSFGAGGGLVLDANDSGTQGSIVASFIILDGNSTEGPPGAHTGGGIWTQGAPITIADTLTMNNTSDYGAGTSFNSGGGDVVKLERVEYRGNQGVHAGATDVYQNSVEMTDCIIKENVGGLSGGVQYGALLVDILGDLTVTTSDLGVDAEDNDPFDVIVSSGAVYPTYDYGDGASFFCDNTAGGCM